MRLVRLTLNAAVLVLGLGAIFFMIGATLEFLRIDVGMADVFRSTIYSSICTILLAFAAVCLDKANQALLRK
ncbi:MULTISPECIES: hypothetical protein [Rhizobium]|uniref:Uncharacterized protein n=3 Tax=Rhizobium TaxID=379 RepID=A0A6P1CBQ4_RHITR|nr:MULTISPECIES: hypothetical protein [Rhizobium]AGB73344.1 hypothetical protein RTCIAT899_PB00155 [Rhizobium tropici CIAT 899]AYG70303.1 hypothetical protein CCGE531_29910 [Rhizobium sp. CCGE531]AYG76677.1 hypothetical protein CCGE532_29415 [Rhizobium sp. CCGE532]ENN86644.1 hypothetical protein RHSP_18734 [Rhizobium freirei PRF 81]MBB4244645.1 hypothetical protein [Rhizobium tropici]